MNDILKNHLHAAMMNIQIEPAATKAAIKDCNVFYAAGYLFHEVITKAYKQGHLDARRAAAKLIKGE